MTFFKTIPTSTQLQFKYEAQTEKQDEIVLDFFRKREPENFTPYEVWIALTNQGVDIMRDCVKRSITTMTTAKLLEKLDGKEGREKVMRMGGFNKPNYCWRFKSHKHVLR